MICNGRHFGGVETPVTYSGHDPFEGQSSNNDGTGQADDGDSPTGSETDSELLEMIAPKYGYGCK